MGNTAVLLLQALLHHDVSFTSLAKAFRNIEQSVAKADRTYKMVLDRYGIS